MVCWIELPWEKKKHFAGEPPKGSSDHISISAQQAESWKVRLSLIEGEGIFAEDQGQKLPKSQHPKSQIMLLSLHNSIYEHKFSPYLKETYCNVNSILKDLCSHHNFDIYILLWHNLQCES